jgi:hypothetical protein
MKIFEQAKIKRWLMITPLLVFHHVIGSNTTTVKNNIEESSVANTSSKVKNDAEEKLETIRQTLVSRALRTQARMKASAWLD